MYNDGCVWGDYILDVYATDVIEESKRYYHKRNVAECVLPDSEILVEQEGKTILAKDIKEGDSIAYYNFETEEIEIGQVLKKYVHENATDFVRYTFEDGTYLEATNYHPIYTLQGWKSLTRRNGYDIPLIGDEVKSTSGWKKINKIETWQGNEDCLDFKIISANGTVINNYYANGTLVQGAYE